MLFIHRSYNCFFKETGQTPWRIDWLEMSDKGFAIMSALIFKKLCIYSIMTIRFFKVKGSKYMFYTTFTDWLKVKPGFILQAPFDILYTAMIVILFNYAVY